jgi:hypothetical protein
MDSASDARVTTEYGNSFSHFLLTDERTNPIENETENKKENEETNGSGGWPTGHFK